MKVSPHMLFIAALVAVVAVLVLTRPEGTDVAQARKDTQKAIAHADQVLIENKSLQLQAEQARAQAAQHEKAAVVAESKLADAKSALFKAALAAPDTCAPVVLAAQDALNKADSVIDIRTHELADMTLADLKDKDRADKAESALIDLKRPAQALVIASKPSLLRRLRPELQAGVIAGVDVTGKPNAVIGIGLGWHF